MGQVIVVEEDRDMTDLLTGQFKKLAGIETIPRKNAIDTIELLKLLPQVKLIVTRSKIGGEDTAKKILDYIEKNKLPTNLVITGTDAIDELTVVEDEKNWEDILYYSFNFLNIPLEGIKKKTREFIPFTIEYFWPLSSLPCSVYLKLKKGPEDFYYLKRFHEGRKITTKSISNYIKEGVTDLFILSEDERSFSNFLSDSYIFELAKEGHSFEGLVDLLNIADSYVRKQISKYGLVKNAVQLGYRIQLKVLELLDLHPLFPDILGYLQKTNLPYIFQSEVIMAGIIKQLTEENFLDMGKYKNPLIEACFLQHMGLGHRDDLALITDMDEVENTGLTFDDGLKAMNHAADAADMAISRQDLLFGADTIIREHHGAVSGIGYPDPPMAQIGKASHLFMVCDHFVRELYVKGKEPFDLENRYEDETSKKIIKKLMDIWRG